MTQEIIDTGDLPNDGSGDPLRAAFEKINNNFSNLFSTLGANLELIDTSAIDGEYIDPNNPQGQNIINIGQIVINNNQIVQQEVQLPPPPTLPTYTLEGGPYGNQQYINVGVTPNDGLGDPLRVAFEKINNNFSNLFLTSTTTTTSYTVGTDANQVIFEYPVAEFTQAEFQISSSDAQGANSQSILISAHLKNSATGVKWTGYGTNFEGDPLTRYDMDVIAGNVTIFANPIANTVQVHFIASTITWIGDQPPGIDIALDGYPTGNVLGTENGMILTTEN